MAINMVRMTIFALLSSLENDIRKIISTYLISIDSNNFPAAILEKCKERVIQDGKCSGSEINVSEIVDFLDFKESLEIVLRNKQNIPEFIYNFLKGNESLIAELVPIRNRVAHSRPLEIDDLPRTMDIIDTLLSGVVSEIFVSLISTKMKIKEDPMYVCNIPLPDINDKEATIFNNLPLPEFEDTGFIGRKDLLASTIKMCLGPWPVISLIGDGGLGKTALAVKAAYDIMYMDNCPFDAIIWTSSKTSQLTHDEIKKIENSISTSVGMFNNLSEIIGPDDKKRPMDNILEFMKLFRVLLIIDNLETIIDDSIYSFLSDLPNGSKILITSRIGLGIEYKIKIDPLTSKEAISFLRTLASIRNTTNILAMHNSKLQDYCQKMNNNPGFIKWFVSALIAGKRPEEILSDSGVFLDYCMSNVYRYLDDQSKKILRSMLCISRELSQAELSFINDLDSISLRSSIQELTKTNMVSMNSISRGSTFESKYEITEFARQYLSRHHPVKSEEFKLYRQKQNKLQSDAEDLARFNSSNILALDYIYPRSANDHVLIKLLRESLNYSKLKNFSMAKKNIDEAKNLDPGYFEVKRIEATVSMFEGLTSYANDCYQAAIELDPNQGHVRYWYGMFLVKFLGDIDEASKQFEKANLLVKNNYSIQFELAKVFMYQKRFADSIEIIGELLRSTTGLQENTILYDLLIQNRYRESEECLVKEDYLKSIDFLKKAFEIYKNCPDEYRDDTMSRVFEKASYSITKLIKKSQEDNFENIKDKLLELIKLKELIQEKNVRKVAVNKKHGEVYHFVKSNGYGFLIEKDTGIQVFFHVSNFVRQSDLLQLKVGTKIKYIKVINDKNKEEAILLEV